MEVWKVIPTHPRYRVSSRGRVMGPRGELVGSTHPRYHAVSLWHEGVRTNILVHTLVMLLFGPPKPPPYLGFQEYEIAHDDGDSFNNRQINLLWKTHSDNEKDKRRHGTSKKKAL